MVRALHTRNDILTLMSGVKDFIFLLGIITVIDTKHCLEVRCNILYEMFKLLRKFSTAWVKTNRNLKGDILLQQIKDASSTIDDDEPYNAAIRLLGNGIYPKIKQFLFTLLGKNKRMFLFQANMFSWPYHFEQNWFVIWGDSSKC